MTDCPVCGADLTDAPSWACPECGCNPREADPSFSRDTSTRRRTAKPRRVVYATCRCSHIDAIHGGGKCRFIACGCLTFRPKEAIR